MLFNQVRTNVHYVIQSGQDKCGQVRLGQMWLGKRDSWPAILYDNAHWMLKGCGKYIEDTLFCKKSVYSQLLILQRLVKSLITNKIHDHEYYLFNFEYKQSCIHIQCTNALCHKKAEKKTAKAATKYLSAPNLLMICNLKIFDDCSRSKKLGNMPKLYSLVCNEIDFCPKGVQIHQ